MICTNCGYEPSQSSLYCNHCGTKLEQLPEPIVPTVSEEPSPASLKMRRKMVLIPLATAFAVLCGLGICYGYEMKVNHDVQNLQNQAEALALGGKISDAKTLIEKALSSRPKDKTLQADMQLLAKGEDIQKEIEQASEFVKQQKFADANELVDQANSQAKAGNGPLFDMLLKTVSDENATVAVAQVKYEMKDKNTVEELAPLLTKLSNLTTPQAKDAATEVQKQISDVSYNTASDLLDKKQFSSALKVIDQGLQYDPKDDKLLSFKESIQKQQSDFEQAEHQRIEQAMVAAAKEDQNNRTHAVQVVKIDSNLDEYGDFIVTGQVKNVATRSISMVKVFFTVYDSNGVALGDSSTYVYPNLLAPGDTGTFERSYYGISQAKTVKVTNTTWYVN